MPLTALFARKKTVHIEIEKPVLALEGDDLKIDPSDGDLGSRFDVKSIAIHAGELNLRRGDLNLVLQQVDIISSQRRIGSVYKLYSPHLRISIPIRNQMVTVAGNLRCEFKQLPGLIKITDLLWETEFLRIHLNGKILANGTAFLNSFVSGNPEQLLRPLLDDLAIHDMCYANARIMNSRKGILQINATISSPTISIMGDSFNNLSGNLSWNSQTNNLAIKARFNAHEMLSSIDILSNRANGTVSARNIPAATVVRIVGAYEYAPLAGNTREVEVRIDQDFIDGKAVFDNGDFQVPAPSPFMLTGEVRFLKDKKRKLIDFSSRDALTNAGRLTIKGQVDILQKKIDVGVQAKLRNVEHVAPLTLFYLELDLTPWDLQKGDGVLQLDFSQRHRYKQFKCRFHVNHIFTNQQYLDSLQGDVDDSPEVTHGLFSASAADLQGKAELTIRNRVVGLDFREISGESAKICKILKLDVDSRGVIQGDFSYRNDQRQKLEWVEGRLQAATLDFLGYPLRDVRTALRSDLSDIELSGLTFRFHEGNAQADVRIDWDKKDFAIRGRIDNIDLHQLNKNIQGGGVIDIQGQGAFFTAPLVFNYRLTRMRYYPDREFQVAGSGRILTDFGDYALQTSGQVVNASSQSPFSLELEKKGAAYSGSFTLKLKDLNLLIPWKNNNGEMDLRGQILPTAGGAVTTQGVAIFSGANLAFPNFSHSLNNFQGFITFQGQNFVLQSLAGEFGGGRLQGNGLATLDKGQIQNLSLNFSGQNMELYPMDRTRCRLNGDVTLRYLNRRLLAQGTLNFLSVNWEREVDEDIVFSSSSDLTAAESSIFSLLQFDLHLQGEDDIWMNNSTGKLKGRFDLQLSGDASFPILTGVIESDHGEIFFSDRSFNIIKAKAIFNNRFTIDPLISVESETFVQNYRIRFDIKGVSSHLKPEFVSSPPLPAQDIMALISLGEIFQRPSSQEVSSQIGSTSLITTKLTEQIKKRANKLLGIDMLRFDPLGSGQSSFGSSRLTIGKSISKDLIIVYSTSFSTSRHEILYLQYQLSPSLLLIGMRNEEGRYSVDIRYRKRN